MWTNHDPAAVTFTLRSRPIGVIVIIGFPICDRQTTIFLKAPIYPTWRILIQKHLTSAKDHSSTKSNPHLTDMVLYCQRSRPVRYHGHLQPANVNLSHFLPTIPRDLTSRAYGKWRLLKATNKDRYWIIDIRLLKTKQNTKNKIPSLSKHMKRATHRTVEEVSLGFTSTLNQPRPWEIKFIRN